jgi:hypothetical protein
MKKITTLLSLGLFAVALSASTSAFADTFTFSFSGTSGSNPSQNQFSGSGSFTATEQSTGVYLITGISGFITEGSNVGTGDTEAIDGIIGVGDFSSSNHSTKNDNLLYYPTSSANNNNSFDKNGLAFTLDDGSQIILYNNDGFDTWTLNRSNKSVSEQISQGFSVQEVPAGSPVPEPGSLALFGTGILGISGTLRRKLIG